MVEIDKTLKYSDETAFLELQETAEKLHFGSIDGFINLFNAGVLKDFGEVKDLRHKIVETVDNIAFSGRQLIYVSQLEISAEHTAEELPLWYPVAVSQRILLHLLDRKVVSRDDTIAVDTSYRQFFTVNTDGDEITFKPASDEKIRRSVDLKYFFATFSSFKDNEELAVVEENKLFFKVSDFVDVDLSFISRLSEEMPSLLSDDDRVKNYDDEEEEGENYTERSEKEGFGNNYDH